MNIDATFWVTVSFFIFCGGLIYLKVPHKINDSLTQKINEISKEISEAEKIKIEAKNLLSNYENKIDKSKKEAKDIVNDSKKECERIILEKTEKFHKLMEDRKKNTEFKISQMKENALREIKNTSIKISMEATKNLIQNSIDKNKLEKFYIRSLEQAKISLKNAKS